VLSLALSSSENSEACVGARGKRGPPRAWAKDQEPGGARHVAISGGAMSEGPDQIVRSIRYCEYRAADAENPDSATAIGRSRKTLATPLSQVRRLGKLPELQVL
jgi:hypothetical protein